MNREQYLPELGGQLADVPEQERTEILGDYEEHLRSRDARPPEGLAVHPRRALDLGPGLGEEPVAALASSFDNPTPLAEVRSSGGRRLRLAEREALPIRVGKLSCGVARARPSRRQWPARSIAGCVRGRSSVELGATTKLKKHRGEVDNETSCRSDRVPFAAGLESGRVHPTSAGSAPGDPLRTVQGASTLPHSLLGLFQGKRPPFQGSAVYRRIDPTYTAQRTSPCPPIPVALLTNQRAMGTAGTLQRCRFRRLAAATRSEDRRGG